MWKFVFIGSALIAIFLASSNDTLSDFEAIKILMVGIIMAILSFHIWTKK